MDKLPFSEAFGDHCGTIHADLYICSEIDPESRVVDKSGKPIPGLFAAGEVAGGVHGANRRGGSSLLGSVVFGRVSGDSAASYLLPQEATSHVISENIVRTCKGQKT